MRKALEPEALVRPPRSPSGHSGEGHWKMQLSVASSCVEVL